MSVHTGIFIHCSRCTKIMAQEGRLIILYHSIRFGENSVCGENVQLVQC